MNIGQGNTANTTHAVLNNKAFNSGKPSPRNATNPVSKNVTSQGNNFAQAASAGGAARGAVRHDGTVYVSGAGGYSLRGTLESLENKMQDILTEISYHR